MKSEEMSALFDIDVGNNLEESDSSDYNTSQGSESNLRSFDEKCSDIKNIMDTETEIQQHHDIISNAMIKASTPAAPIIKNDKPDNGLQDEEEIVDENTDQYTDEVSNDMKEFDIEEGTDDTQGGSSEISDIVASEKAPPQTKQNTDELLDGVEEDVFIKKEDPNNPLGLCGDELKFYHECKQKYPRFELFDGSVSFKEFYRHKVYMLQQILTKYPVLDVQDLIQEVGEINVDHFINQNVIVTPDVIRRKIDESYQWRSRLSSILLKIIPQFYIWERWTEMLRAKLWKDHEIKGAHRRDGTTLEHMSDIEQYFVELKSVLEVSKHVDAILKAASDSLSRQLSCLQNPEATGFIQKVDYKSHYPTRSPDLDKFDSIGSGEKISAPIASNTVVTASFGVESDDLADLG